MGGFTVLRDLLRYAIGRGASGIGLHLNNLENLSEVEASRAADLLRGIRDQALEDGIPALLGLTSAGADAAPVGLEEQLGDTAWARLLAWARVDPASVQTQAQLVELWRVKQPSVSQTLQHLIEAGVVEALPHRGREAIPSLMTDLARLAL